jgi:hypothetical protein
MLAWVIDGFGFDFGRKGGEHTIKAWIPELYAQNSQIAGHMKRIPAHMHIIAPAWWYVCRVLDFLPLARIIMVSTTS